MLTYQEFVYKSTSLQRVLISLLLSRVVNETYDAETETRRSKRRLETFGRDVQAVSSH